MKPDAPYPMLTNQGFNPGFRKCSKWPGEAVKNICGKGNI